MYNIIADIEAEEVRNNGDFSVTKRFYVKNQHGEDATGIIIQYITKKANVYHSPDGIEKIYDTSQKISEFTDGNVLFSNDNYLEIFEVTEGVSEEDVFQNGALAKYDPLDGEAFIDNEDRLYMTKGSITHSGECIFVPYSEYETMSKILSYPWCEYVDHNSELFDFNKCEFENPANGIPFIGEQYKNEIFKLGQNFSNTIFHTVRIKWDYHENNSVIENCLTNVPYNSYQLTREYKQHKERADNEWHKDNTKYEYLEKKRTLKRIKDENENQTGGRKYKNTY